MEKDKISRVLLWIGIAIVIGINLNSHQFSDFHPIRGIAILLIVVSLVVDLYGSDTYRKLLFLVTIPCFLVMLLFLGGAYKTMESILGLDGLVSFILLSVITIPTLIVTLYIMMKSSRFIAEYFSIEIDSREEAS